MTRTRAKELVIHCPGKTHAAGVSREANPKILMIVAGRRSSGRFRVQCNDNRCKHSQGADYNGWYEIALKAGGTYSISPIPRCHFELYTVPAVILSGER